MFNWIPLRLHIILVSTLARIFYQHLVLDEEETLKIYRFWTHFFSHNDLRNILQVHDFDNLSFHENVLPEGDLWNGDNVTFCKAINKK
jgi:hypothetical protein